MAYRLTNRVNSSISVAGFQLGYLEYVDVETLTSDMSAAAANGGIVISTPPKKDGQFEQVRLPGAGEHECGCPSYQKQQLTSASTILWDLTKGGIGYVVLTGNSTLANPTVMLPGTFTLIVDQDGTGGRTLAYGDKYLFRNGVPTVSSGPGNRTVLFFVSDGDKLYGKSMVA